jgi:hypothetical protein
VHFHMSVVSSPTLTYLSNFGKKRCGRCQASWSCMAIHRMAATVLFVCSVFVRVHDRYISLTSVASTVFLQMPVWIYFIQVANRKCPLIFWGGLHVLLGITKTCKRVLKSIMEHLNQHRRARKRSR